MSKIRQLALTWQCQAALDAKAARHHESVREVMAAIAQTRRNDAWELLRLLNEEEQEQESPLHGGPLCAAQSGCTLG